MKLDINENSLWAVVFICIAIAVISITFALWNYNVTAVKCYTENNYEQISDKGTNRLYWRK